MLRKFRCVARFLRLEGEMHPRIALLLGTATGSLFVYRERRSKKAVERMAAGALETLLNAIEANDEETGMHVRRVAACALIIADAAGLSDKQKHEIERVALFHDIGKIHEALFDIVHSPRKLTHAERQQILTHPYRGADVLQPLEAFYPELPLGVMSHHERWDGSGYPRHLKGRRIPLTARIVSIADTFDAVAHSRRYRHGRGFATAAKIIAQGRGTQFDPELVDLALLPPVLNEMSAVRVERVSRRQGRRGREPERERIPEISFRWRSESLNSSRVAAARGLK